MNERVAFGLELRRVRERRGLSIEQVCEQTKVSVTHYAALEAGDLSRWPSGIFRRAFVRSYATAVGLDPDDTVMQFGRIFPDPADGPRAAARMEAALREEALALAEGASEPFAELPKLRLSLDTSHSEQGLDWFRTGGPRLASATIDILLALIPAGVAALAFGRGWFLPTATSVGFVGHVVYYSLMGATPGKWAMTHMPRELTGRLARGAARRRPDGEESADAHRRTSGHTPGRPAAHAHRVRH
jgi:transcriptional regulator with XRE-family HTH domain